MSKPRMLFLSALSALFLSLALPTSTAIASPIAAERATAQRVDRGVVPERSTDRDSERYAERERLAAQLETFEGGRTVIVIGSVGALLLGALLVLLLI